MQKRELQPGDEAWVVDTTGSPGVRKVKILERNPRPGHPHDLQYTVEDEKGQKYRYSVYLVFTTEEAAMEKLRSRVVSRRDRDLAHADRMQNWLDEHPEEDDGEHMLC